MMYDGRENTSRLYRFALPTRSNQLVQKGYAINRDNNCDRIREESLRSCIVHITGRYRSMHTGAVPTMYQGQFTGAGRES